MDVTERLRDMIVENELALGERIDEKMLCDLLQISRTPLREALKVLAFEGLVELLPNRGARVSDMSAREVAELFEVSAGLERMAAELAAERATEGELAELRRMQESMERCFRSGRRSDYFRLNQRIHNSVIAFARNKVLAESHGVLMTRIRRARYQAIMSQSRWEESVREHEDLLRALEERDARHAGEILRRHVLGTGKTIHGMMEAEPAEVGSGDPAPGRDDQGSAPRVRTSGAELDRAGRSRGKPGRGPARTTMAPDGPARRRDEDEPDAAV